jgi:hypothetical protein
MALRPRTILMGSNSNNNWTVPHQDSYAGDLDATQGGSYSVDITVTASDDSDEDDEIDVSDGETDGAPEHQAEDEEDTDEDDEIDVSDRGTDVTLEHPVEDPEQLRHRAHLTSQLADQNSSEQEPDDPVVAFDNAVLDVADRSLDAAGINATTAPIEPPYLYAFLLHDVWGFNSRLKLRRHLEAHPSIAERLGMEELPSSSALYRRAQKLEDEDVTDALQEASERAVHAVWRNGYNIPESVLKHWDLDAATALDEYAVSEATRRTAIRNWVELLLGDAADALTFHRASNAAYSIKEYLGVMAHSALQNIGITAVQDTAGWLYNSDDFPGGDSLIKQVKDDDLDLADIETQFAAANAAVFERADALGFFGEPLDFAYDTVDVTWWGYPTGATVGKRRPATDATPDWVYCVLIAVTTDARLCFGVNLVKSKDLYDRALDDQLQTATTYADIRHLYADKEFYDGGVIETLRRHIGDGWVIKAQRRDRVKEFIGDLLENEPGYRESLPVTSATPNPSAFAVPNDASGQQMLAQFSGETSKGGGDGATDTHTVYLTDRDAENLTAEELDDRYDQRWSVETAMRQYRHDMHPVCHSGDVKIRVYCANTAMLFLNWHALINKSLSPELNLPLTVTHQELLTAIRDVAFSDTDSQAT